MTLEEHFLSRLSEIHADAHVVRQTDNYKVVGVGSKDLVYVRVRPGFIRLDVFVRWTKPNTRRMLRVYDDQGISLAIEFLAHLLK